MFQLNSIYSLKIYKFYKIEKLFASYIVLLNRKDARMQYLINSSMGKNELNKRQCPSLM